MATEVSKRQSLVSILSTDYILRRSLFQACRIHIVKSSGREQKNQDSHPLAEVNHEEQVLNERISQIEKIGMDLP